MSLTRQQRRRLERAKLPHDKWPSESLSEYLNTPNLNVKRGELPGAVEKMVRLLELQRKLQRPHKRAIRWLRKKLTIAPEIQGNG